MLVIENARCSGDERMKQRSNGDIKMLARENAEHFQNMHSMSSRFARLIE